MGDGSGRDTYVVKNNGGLCIESEHPQYESGMFFTRRNYGSPHPMKESTAFKYISDGSGRDSYVSINSGGLHSPAVYGSHKNLFANTLRSTEKITWKRDKSPRNIYDYQGFVSQKNLISLRNTLISQKDQAMRLSTPKFFIDKRLSVQEIKPNVGSIKNGVFNNLKSEIKSRNALSRRMSQDHLSQKDQASDFVSDMNQNQIELPKGRNSELNKKSNELLQSKANDEQHLLKLKNNLLQLSAKDKEFIQLLQSKGSQRHFQKQEGDQFKLKSPKESNQNRPNNFNNHTLELLRRNVNQNTTMQALQSLKNSKHTNVQQLQL
eukprot:403335973